MEKITLTRMSTLVKDLKSLVEANTRDFHELTAFLNELSELVHPKSFFASKLFDLLTIAINGNFDTLVTYFLQDGPYAAYFVEKHLGRTFTFGEKPP